MSTAPDFTAFQTITTQLAGVATIPRAALDDLATRFAKIVTEDNRKGVLQGQGGDGRPLRAVKYRTGTAAPLARTRRRVDVPDDPSQVKRKFAYAGGTKTLPGLTTRKKKYQAQFGQTVGRFKGEQASTANNNLTTAQYKKMTGPPLAPRRESSRVISNFGHLATETSGNGFTVVLGWLDVISRKGVAFLGAHFDGKNRLPKRDLRGVRAWGIAEAEKSTGEWVQAVLKSLGIT